MKLKKIYFDAFKSLFKKELEINDNCIGLVGTNESGKSNLLHAINVLGGDRKLTASDAPKMGRGDNPAIRFEFELLPDEHKVITDEWVKWLAKNTLNCKNIQISNFIITYHVIFNKVKKLEERFFCISGVKLSEDCLILSQKYFNDLYKIRYQESFVPLNKAIIIKADTIINNDKFLEIYDNLETVKKSIEELNTDIEAMHANSVPVEKEEQPAGEQKTKTPSPELDKRIIKTQERLDKLISIQGELESNLEDFNFRNLLASIEQEIEDNSVDITRLETELKPTEAEILNLKNTTSPSEEQKKQLDDAITRQEAKQKEIIEIKKNKKQKEEELKNLKIPIYEKYTSDTKELNRYLANILQGLLVNYLPKVVFWKHSDDYIIKSQILFDDILAKDDLNKISRPLVNIFRMGLQIKTIEELHENIKKIQDNGNERSRLMKKLNKNINNYIKSVWGDYDQEINITLENDRIRIEIYDPAPNHDDASYYNMEERSQGAQTFLSFLLTIGAEAKQGVIKDTILLLDEPETHLHPSGVRFLLKELIKIANRNNIVIYATHSIFMIDRENYNRHIILGKEKEQTIIKPSNKGRIGFFMQEEVLYSTLDIDLNKDFVSTKICNFVFEGHGDAIIFEHFYTNECRKQHIVDLDKTSFYHGGKCSHIKKYLTHKPIQLGTKWIFILDKDDPADDLKKLIENKYKDYLGKDIHVFQYTKDKLKYLELEDILPQKIIEASYIKTAKQHNIKIDNKKLSSLISKTKTYCEYSKHIIEAFGLEDSFKKDFKEILNQEIENKIALLIEKKESFEITFSDYHNWASKVVEEINPQNTLADTK